jgi:hypothetical protein
LISIRHSDLGTYAVSAGKGVLIQKGFIDAHSSGNSIPGANHTFVMAVDQTNGAAYATRGGPGSGPGGGPGIGPLALVTTSGPYGPGFPDHGSVPVLKPSDMSMHRSIR